MSVITSVGIIYMKNRDGDRTGCFDVCRGDTAVYLRINRNRNEVVAVIPLDVTRQLAELLVKAAGGFCKEGDRCVCGGDTPAIQAQCGNWIK